MANLLPQNVLHKTTKDVTIGGHLIPEGTTIVPQISAVLYDERVCNSAGGFGLLTKSLGVSVLSLGHPKFSRE